VSTDPLAIPPSLLRAAFPSPASPPLLPALRFPARVTAEVDAIHGTAIAGAAVRLQLVPDFRGQDRHVAGAAQLTVAVAAGRHP
jgi:hypothetical protein